MKKADSRQKGRTEGEEDTDKCHGQVGKGQGRGGRGLMATYMCKFIRGNVWQQKRLKMESGKKKKTICDIAALLCDKDMQQPQKTQRGEDRLCDMHYSSGV